MIVVKDYLFLGRFQPFHYEHKGIVDYFKKNFSFYPIIGIYKPKNLDFYNPFDVNEVKGIISSYFLGQKLYFIEIDNLLNVLKLVRNYNIIIGSTRKKYLYKLFAKSVIEIPTKREITSTKIKKALINKEENLKDYVNEYTIKKLKEKESLLKEDSIKSLKKVLDKFGKIHLYF